MIYDADIVQFYDSNELESYVEDDEISGAEEGFMQGYLSWKRF